MNQACTFRWPLAALALCVLLAMVPLRPAHSGQTYSRVVVGGVQDETLLPAYLFKPEGNGRFPAVVFLHGCSGIGVSGSLSSTYSAWARHLNEVGIAALIIDSLTPRGFVSACGNVPARKVMYRQRPLDAYAGLAYLQSRADIIGDRIGLMGWSQGGGITLLTINSRGIGKPVPPPGHGFKAAVALYPSACSDRLQSEPYTRVKRGTWETDAPLLVLHGAKDNWTRPEPCKAFVKAAQKRGEPVSITIYPDAAHSFDAPNLPLRRRSSPRLADGSYPLLGTDQAARKDAMQRVAEFFGQRLR